MDLDYESALARCWEFCRRGDVGSALSEAMTLNRQAVAQGAEEAAALAAGMIGWFCFQAGEAEAGIEHAYAAKMFWAGRGDASREAWVGSVYAWLLLEAGLSEEAADEAVKALSLAEQSGDDIATSWAVNVLGAIFWHCRQLERAQVLCERAVGIARSAGDANLLSWWLVNAGGVHSEIGYRRLAQKDPQATDSLRHALSINQEALTLAREIGDAWCLRLSLANAAEYFIALGELDAADGAIREWEAQPGEGGIRLLTQLLYTKGQLLTKRGRLVEALSVCAHSLALAQSKHQVDSEAQALRYLSETYEALGRFETALAYFKSFHDAQSRLAAEKIQRRARLAEIHYETQRFKTIAEMASRRADQMALTTMLDPLTGIGNRRKLDDALDGLRTGGMGFAIAVIDLDHFKAINDRFSHMVGDKVLQRVAGVLQSAVRQGDVVARLGGEEFVLLMYDADMEAATRRCAALNAQIVTAGWAQIEPGLRVTASIGVAVGDRKTDPSAILALADRRLYIAKAGGRNRVVGAREEAVGEESRKSSMSAPFDALTMTGLPAAARGIDIDAVLRRSV